MAKGSSLPLPFSLGDALAEEAKALAKGSSLLLAGTGDLLDEELLAAGSLLVACVSGVLLKYRLVLVLPQYINGPLPNPVGMVCASASTMKNGPSTWPRRQHFGSLLVFVNGSLMPAFFVMGRGVVAFVVVKQPLRGAWGRLRPFKLQPP